MEDAPESEEQAEAPVDAESKPVKGPDARGITISRSPIEQDSLIPLGWKPTAAKPVPVVRCVVIKKDGDRCHNWSVRGMVKCYTHAKKELNFKNVREHRDAVIEAARMRLLDMADDAADTMQQLMQPGTAEGIRLKAATEVLDRVGIRGGIEVDVEVTEKTDPAQVIRERLERLRSGSSAIEAAEESGEEISDAELVDDDDAQPPLFEL